MKIISFAAAITACALLSACSDGSGGFGDKLSSSGGVLKAASDDWHNANALVIEGQQDIEAGKSQIANGTELIKQGEAKIQQGKATTTKIEAAFKGVVK